MLSFVSVAMAAAVSVAYTVPLKVNEKRCFFEEAKVDTELFAEYTVLNGRRSLEFSIRDPDGTFVFRSDGQDKDTGRKVYVVARRAGPYQFCLENSGAVKTVRIAIQSHVINDDQAVTGEAMGLVGVWEKLAHVQMGLNEIEAEQEILMIRERGVSEGLDGTATYVTCLSLFQLSLVVGISVGQLYYLMSLFKERERRG
eukprot:gene8094-12448_t